MRVQCCNPSVLFHSQLTFPRQQPRQARLSSRLRSTPGQYSSNLSSSPFCFAPSGRSVLSGARVSVDSLQHAAQGAMSSLEEACGLCVEM